MTAKEFMNTYDTVLTRYGEYWPPALCADGAAYSICTDPQIPYGYCVECRPELLPAAIAIGLDVGPIVPETHHGYENVPPVMLENAVSEHGGITGVATYKQMWGRKKPWI